MLRQLRQFQWRWLLLHEQARRFHRERLLPYSEQAAPRRASNIHTLDRLRRLLRPMHHIADRAQHALPLLPFLPVAGPPGVLRKRDRTPSRLRPRRDSEDTGGTLLLSLPKEEKRLPPSRAHRMDRTLLPFLQPPYSEDSAVLRKGRRAPLPLRVQAEPHSSCRRLSPRPAAEPHSKSNAW
jgi:hypothetical protein